MTGFMYMGPQFGRKAFYRLPHDVRRVLWRTLRPGKYSLAQEMRRTQGEYSYEPFDRLGCIFVHIPKTAGVSISRSLFGCLSGGHAAISHYQMVFDSAAFQRYFKFTFVRNPWDRLFSAYRFLSRGGMTAEDAAWAARNVVPFGSFERFVNEWLSEESIRSYPHFIPQKEFVFLPGGTAPAVDFIGRFERLQADFEAVCRRLGVEARLPHENQAGAADQTYREAYNPGMQRKVAELYGDDIEEFGYVF